MFIAQSVTKLGQEMTATSSPSSTLTTRENRLNSLVSSLKLVVFILFYSFVWYMYSNLFCLLIFFFNTERLFNRQ